MIDLINKLYESGDLKKLIDAGLVSYKISFYREVYLDYDKNLQTHPKGSKVQAVSDTATTFNIQESTVYRILKVMKG